MFGEGTEPFDSCMLRCTCGHVGKNHGVSRACVGAPITAMKTAMRSSFCAAPGQAGVWYSAMYRSPACPGAPTTFNK
eukprot:596308-Pleurochrysis_carterae.AAC.1